MTTGPSSASAPASTGARWTKQPGPFGQVRAEWRARGDRRATLAAWAARQPVWRRMLALTAAGALAGGLIAASGRAHTAEEAKAVFDEVYWTLYPSPTDGSYNSWQSAKQARAAQDYHKNEYEQ